LSLPNAIIWDPLSKITELICLHCFEDNGKSIVLKSSEHWTKGQSNSLNPRTIWDIGWFCILIGRIYICENSHRIISHHVGVLQQCLNFDFPFILTHDSGFSSQLFNWIIRFVENGISFAAIQRIKKKCFGSVYESKDRNEQQEVSSCTRFTQNVGPLSKNNN